MLHRSKNKKIMPGVWMAPGGKREFNEGVFECARREIREETGLEIKNLQIKAAGNAYMKDIDQEVFFHFVFAEFASGTVKKVSGDGELRWVTVKEMLKLGNILAELKHVAKHIFSKSTDVISYKCVYEKGNELTNFELEYS